MLRKVLVTGSLLLALAACEDKAERAEGYYQSALELLEAGDVDRAMLELRNVFDNDGFHKEARLLYAELLLERGQANEAYSQYLRLIEQYPDTIDVRRQLAELALDTGNFDEVERHTKAAIELAPEEPAHQALVQMLAYQEAKQSRNDVAAGEAVAATEALLAKDPTLKTALKLLIDWSASSPEPARALPYIDTYQAEHGNSVGLQMVRLRILEGLDRKEEIGEILRGMYTEFPDDPQIPRLLISWYLTQKDFAAAEAFLRTQAGALDGPVDPHLAVVQLIGETRGPAAALAELDKLAEANAGSDTGRRYGLAAASMRYTNGDQTQEAFVATLVEEAEDTDLKNQARVVLSRMKAQTGDNEAARALVEAALTSDPSNVPALLSSAAWKIRDQAFSEAITDLRRALDQDPRNVDVLLLEAEAQQNLGNVELAEQRLAQAVEVSNASPRVAVIYARFQLSQDRTSAAKQVLNDSFRTSGNLQVAQMLGQVLLNQGNMDEAQTLMAALSTLKTQEATMLARDLKAAILYNQNKIDETLAFLRSSSGGGDQDEFSRELQILRVQMISGRIGEAKEHLKTLRGKYPDSVALKLLEGNMLSLEGNIDAAVEVYRRLLGENPDETIVIERLYTSLKDTGREGEASELLVRALEDSPDDRALLMLRALELERHGDVEGAIATYEGLHMRFPEDLIVANNLASMLAYYRTSDEDLEKAYQIARRLTGSTVPALLDTLGYVQLRRGELDRAILNLQAAARGLPQDPTVAFNLAEAYEAAGRLEDAKGELARGLDLTDGRTDVPRLTSALAMQDRLNGG